MSVLKHYFDKDIDQRSPVQKDYARVAKHDDNGNEYITFEEIDYAKLQSSLGTVDMWSLNALLKAGINPDFPIHTGNPTRLEGIDVITQAEAMVDEILNETNNNE